jgi:hypothetical protein
MIPIINNWYKYHLTQYFGVFWVETILLLTASVSLVVACMALRQQKLLMLIGMIYIITMLSAFVTPFIPLLNIKFSFVFISILIIPIIFALLPDPAISQE